MRSLPDKGSINTLSAGLSSYLAKEQVNSVRRAYFYAEQAHDGQYRHSGDPYVSHPLAVALILSEMHMDHQSLMAAMLHDVIEDTGVTKTAIKNQFGNAVADLVDGVSKLNKITFSSRAEAQAENFQKMAMAMAKDLRVIMVKIADRLHNMRTLGVLNAIKRRRIARETLDIYAPIANRLGMNNVRIEFEELGFAALYPMRAKRISAEVKKIRGNRKEYYFYGDDLTLLGNFARDSDLHQGHSHGHYHGHVQQGDPFNHPHGKNVPQNHHHSPYVKDHI